MHSHMSLVLLMASKYFFVFLGHSFITMCDNVCNLLKKRRFPYMLSIVQGFMIRNHSMHELDILRPTLRGLHFVEVIAMCLILSSE